LAFWTFVAFVSGRGEEDNLDTSSEQVGEEKKIKHHALPSERPCLNIGFDFEFSFFFSCACAVF